MDKADALTYLPFVPEYVKLARPKPAQDDTSPTSYHRAHISRTTTYLGTYSCYPATITPPALS
jgi:hypothetical protein